MDLLQSIQNTMKQRPQSVASLFKRHRFEPLVTNRNVSNAIKLSPAFFNDLLSMVNGGSYSNATGEVERFTLAERLANAGLVFSNVLQASSRKPEKFVQRVPAYYEPTGKYNVMTYDQRGGYNDYPSTRIFGIDRKIAIGLGIALLLFIIYEFNKK